MDVTLRERTTPARLERHLDRLTRRRRSLGAPQIALRGPDQAFTYGDQNRAFHAASVGKLFTGAIILQLAAAGRLDIESRVDDLLPSATLAGLFRTDAPAPTVLDLLQHYSGAADYFEGHRGTSVLSELQAHPERAWTPAELLDFSREHLRPVGRPGERFHYSDTGFVLLGLIVEEVTGRRYDQAVHEQIIEPLGLTRTFLPGLTSPAEGDATLAPIWIGTQELSTAAGLTCAWAGGGIASTPGDLLTFSEALHGGRLVTPEHLTLMATPRGRLRGGIHYGAAMMELRFEGFAPVMRGRARPLGHLGSTGTSLFYDPSSGAHLAMNFHARRELPRLIRTAIAIQTAAG